MKFERLLRSMSLIAVAAVFAAAGFFGVTAAEAGQDTRPVTQEHPRNA